MCSHISTRLPKSESLGSEHTVTQVWLSTLQQGWDTGVVTSLVRVTEYPYPTGNNLKKEGFILTHAL